MEFLASYFVHLTILLASTTYGFLSPQLKDCRGFLKDKFLPKNYPKPLKKVGICQRLNTVKYYATMYNLEHKIPLYSAYKMDPSIEKDQPPDLKKWMVELGLSAKGGDMGDENELTKKEAKIQAVNKDYTEAKEPVVRGQMCPKIHRNKEARTATFTLTNAAPLYEKFQAVWRIVEQETKKLMMKKCIGALAPGTPFFVPGPIPGPTQIAEKVHIPTHAYVASACAKDSPGTFSFGVMGPNDESAKSPKDIPILVTDVVTLGKKIKEYWGMPPPPEAPIKFFKDDGNPVNNVAVNELKDALKDRGVNVVEDM
ncbi:endonuclease domain-containing 1 protein-like [Clytia hemisphaerica]|uniref:Uncharacterized protein n=1 Tax=Clytia hemisphaerica TaxID=252671 RepID=A0A7M5VEL6_9CNID|eukprot:TCONS_00027230-protein